MVVYAVFFACLLKLVYDYVENEYAG